MIIGNGRFTSMTVHLTHILVALATAFLVALLAGRVVARFHLPRVTGYLLSGLVAGPAVAEAVGVPALLDRVSLSEMQLLSDIALALMMFTIGAQFRAERLRRWGRRIVTLAVCETFITFLLVALSTAVLNIFVVQRTIDPNLDVTTSSIHLGLFLGIIAMATAPAATLLVIREYESQGPLTDIVMALVGLNNLVTILGFTCVTHFLVLPGEGFTLLLAHLFLPFVIGGTVGFGLSAWEQQLETPTDTQLLVLGTVIGVVGLCRLLGLHFLLGCFVCGVVVVNASPRERRLFDALRQVDYPLYVLFFVLAGASLHLETLSHIGLLGLVYIAARSCGKLLGSQLGVQFGQFSMVTRRWIGPALLAQAGVAIGLSATLRETWPGGGYLVETIVLSSVVIFELVGPIAVRVALVQAGEVPLLTLLTKRAPEGSFESFHHIVDHFRLSLGLPAGHTVNNAADILVKHIMRTNIDTIHDASPFQEVLRLIAHSPYDRFPVVNAQEQFKGVIDYSDIRDVLFDPILMRVVVAGDLAKSEPLRVRPNQTLGEALTLFREHKNVSYLPVIEEQEPDRLLGMVSQNDVLAAFRQLKQGV